MCYRFSLGQLYRTMVNIISFDPNTSPGKEGETVIFSETMQECPNWLKTPCEAKHSEDFEVEQL